MPTRMNSRPALGWWDCFTCFCAALGSAAMVSRDSSFDTSAKALGRSPARPAGRSPPAGTCRRPGRTSTSGTGPRAAPRPPAPSSAPGAAALPPSSSTSSRDAVDVPQQIVLALDVRRQRDHHAARPGSSVGTCSSPAARPRARPRSGRASGTSRTPSRSPSAARPASPSTPASSGCVSGFTSVLEITARPNASMSTTEARAPPPPKRDERSSLCERASPLVTTR